MCRGLHRKYTFEDRFDRKYACWAKNEPSAWQFWKRRNRRVFRQKLKAELREEIEHEHYVAC